MVRIGSLILFLFVAPNAFSGGLSGSIDKNQGTTEDVFELTLVVEGELEGEVQVPKVPGLRIQRLNRTHSETHIVGGTMRTLQKIFYHIRADEAGSYQVPSFTATIDGASQSTAPISLTVEKAAEAVPGASNVYVERHFSAESVYEGFPVTMRTRIFHSIEIGNLSPGIDLPDGLTVVLEEKPKQFQRVIGGKRYGVVEFTQVLLSSSAGRFILPAPRFRFDVIIQQRGFFGGSRRLGRETTGKAATLEFKELPQPVPSDFSGLVGSYSLQVEGMKASLSVGENLSLLVKLVGQGRLKGYQVPLPGAPAGIKIYDDQPQVQESAHESLGMISDIQKGVAVVASRPGQVHLPPIKVVYFDTDQKTYKILEYSFPVLNVTGEAENLPKTAERKMSRSFDTELLGLHRFADYDGVSTLSVPRWTIPVLLFLPWVYLWGCHAYISFWKQGPGSRKRRARALFRSSLKRLGSEARLEELLSCLRSYFADRFGENAAALTAGDVVRHLEERSCSNDLIERASKLFADLERYQYSPEQPGPSQVSELLARMEELTSEVEAACT